MHQREVYQWGERVGERLGLGHWQGQMLAGLSLGIIEGRSCTLSTVAEHLGCLGQADSVERGIQGWLNNERIGSEAEVEVTYWAENRRRERAWHSVQAASRKR